MRLLKYELDGFFFPNADHGTKGKLTLLEGVVIDVVCRGAESYKLLRNTIKRVKCRHDFVVRRLQ